MSTKFYVPPARADSVARPELSARLLAAVARPQSFSLISGPAGSGKTTLLSQFVAQLERSAHCRSPRGGSSGSYSSMLYGTSTYFIGDKQPYLEDWATLFRLLQEGKINPVIARRFPILEAARANERSSVAVTATGL